MPEVDRVLGNAEKLALDFLGGCSTRLAEEKRRSSDIMAVRQTAAAPDRPHRRPRPRFRADTERLRSSLHLLHHPVRPRQFALGAARRREVEQVRRLIERGYREIVLTGVDLTSYGAGLPGAPRLGTLVKRILKELPELARLRLSSIDSVEADADLFDALGNEPRLMPHLHLSLQAGDDLILKRMKRRHLRADSIAFCDQVRRLRPDVAFGGDIIAGFPTETDEMFARSLDLVDECGLTQLHVFPFSPRRGTPAERMPQVAPEVVKERAGRLREKGEAALRRHLGREIGARRRVLAEAHGLARTEQFTPVRLGAAAPRGAIFEVRIAGHDGRQLLVA